MSAVLLAQQILNGLLDGVYYLLIALGLSLIFSLGGIVNLAHGAFYAIGAYLTLVLSPYLGFGGSFVAAPVVVALFGVVIELTFFSRFYRSDPLFAADDIRPLPWWRSRRFDDLSAHHPCPTYSASGCADRSRSAALSIRFIASSCLVLQRHASPACGCRAKDFLAACARRRPESRHGRRARHFAATLYVRVAALGISPAGLAGVLLAPLSNSIHPAMGQEIITPACGRGDRRASDRSGA
jgi:branched-chain amino acid transport system permease protein